MQQWQQLSHMTEICVRKYEYPADLVNLSCGPHDTGRLHPFQYTRYRVSQKDSLNEVSYAQRVVHYNVPMLLKVIRHGNIFWDTL